jgi:hypothetical protein
MTPLPLPRLPLLVCPTSVSALSVTIEDGEIRVGAATPFAPDAGPQPHEWRELTVAALPTRSRFGVANGWYCIHCLALMDVSQLEEYRLQFVAVIAPAVVPLLAEGGPDA